MQDAQSMLFAVATSSLTAAGVTFALNYYFNSRNLAAKLNDRIYELNKLALTNSGAFQSFFALKHRSTDDYFLSATTQSSQESGAIVVQHRSIAYYYLNLFEEMYHAHYREYHQDSIVWTAWKNYLFERLKHPLIREIMCSTMGFTPSGSDWLRDENKNIVYPRDFVDFLWTNKARWKGPCTTDDL